MTGNRKSLKLSTVLSSLRLSSLGMEIKKSSRGSVAVVSGVVKISAYTAETVELLSHSGRVCFVGEELSISVMEGRVVEIYGRITEVRFSYGKTG